MDCRDCLNLQDDGLCGVYGKEPPEGFAARCLRFAQCGVRRVESGVEQPREAASQNSTLHSQPSTLKRLCLAEYCPFLVTELPGMYCMARVLPDRTEYLKLEEETPCPRHWTI